MKKCKSKEELIFDFEVLDKDMEVANKVDIQQGEKGDYVIHFPNGSFFLMTETFFKNNFEIIEEESESHSDSLPLEKLLEEKIRYMISLGISYEKYTPDVRKTVGLLRDFRINTIKDSIETKKKNLERNEEFLKEALKIPLAKSICEAVNDDSLKIRYEIEELKCTLDRMENNSEE